MTANCIQKTCASLRRVCAVALALCIALGALSLPVSARADAASFVQVSLAGANAYDSANAATILQAGTVLMLQNPVKAAYNGQEYYYVYYNSAVYHILATEVSPISEADAQTYVRNNLWTSTAFTTLKRELNLTGEIRVYALQLALQTLGYYSNSLDGNYGKGTEKAVYKFQRANGLTKDGDAGPLTQQALFALARNKGTTSGGSSSGGSSSGPTVIPGTTGTSGTLRTVASVNLREKATQSSTKLASVPVNSVLTYYNTSVSGGVTWYQVLYNNKNGWLMGTYVNVTSSSSGTASGTLTTTAKVNLRKSSSKSSVRLGVVPMGVKLAYIDAKTSGGVTWYKVSYGVNTGWLMGTYVNASGSGSSSGGNTGGSSGGTVTVTGKVEITKVSTRVRKTPGGAKTGVVLAKGSVVEMIGASVASGGYTWYPVRTGSVTGYVRGDCATVVGESGGGSSSGGSSSGRGDNDKNGCLWLLLGIALLPILLTYWLWTTDMFKLSKKARAGIIAVMWAVLIILGIVGGNNKESTQQPPMPTATIAAETPQPTAAPTATPQPTATPTPEPTATPEPAEAKPTMVYIANSGTKYHRLPSCSGMENPTEVTLEQAESWGYTPCKRCY